MVGNGSFLGIGGDEVGQRFKIVLEYYILPIHTAEYYDDLLNDIPPIFFKNNERIRIYFRFKKITHNDAPIFLTIFQSNR